MERLLQVRTREGGAERTALTEVEMGGGGRRSGSGSESGGGGGRGLGCVVGMHVAV